LDQAKSKRFRFEGGLIFVRCDWLGELGNGLGNWAVLGFGGAIPPYVVAVITLALLSSWTSLAIIISIIISSTIVIFVGFLLQLLVELAKSIVLLGRADAQPFQFVLCSRTRAYLSRTLSWVLLLKRHFASQRRSEKGLPTASCLILAKSKH